jgi:hypothetical protein
MAIDDGSEGAGRQVVVRLNETEAQMLWRHALDVNLPIALAAEQLISSALTRQEYELASRIHANSEIGGLRLVSGFIPPVGDGAKTPISSTTSSNGASTKKGPILSGNSGVERVFSWLERHPLVTGALIGALCGLTWVAVFQLAGELA